MAKRELGLEKIASEVGRLFGTTEAYAQRWLDQREELLNALAIVRDKASGLISELGGEHLPWRASGKATPGIPVVQPGMRESRKKRVLSAATRAKMRAAAKKRWAAIRKTTSRSNRQK